MRGVLAVLAMALAVNGCSEDVPVQEAPDVAPVASDTAERPARSGGGSSEPASNLGKAKGAAENVISEAEARDREMQKQIDDLTGD